MNKCVCVRGRPSSEIDGGWGGMVSDWYSIWAGYVNKGGVSAGEWGGGYDINIGPLI